VAAVNDDYILQDGERTDPVLWIETVPQDDLAMLRLTDVSDAVMHRYIGPGKGRKIKSFGHDAEGRHFLLTRAGTPVHNDKTYTRYSHQLVIRNDGNRLRGLPRFDKPLAHPKLVPGVMYCLDTHSPHQGLPDDRFPTRSGMMKAVIAVDRDNPMTPADFLALIRPWLGISLADVTQPDPNYKRAPVMHDGRPVR
jgi:hypothetical protein